MKRHGKISVEHALAQLLSPAVQPRQTVMRSPLKALHHVSATDIATAIAQPPFNRSPLDGFALRHSDTAGAAKTTPVTLRIVETVYAGEAPVHELRPGDAARIMTGAPLPVGATCVVRQEDVEYNAEYVTLFGEMREYQNFCHQGEDVTIGNVVLARGTRITSAIAGVLAGQGIASLPVYPRPRIGILSTGRELARAGNPLVPGKIYDSNETMLAARIVEIGAEPVLPGTAEDTPSALAACVVGLLAGCDMAVTTGGVSVGEHDYLPAVAEHLDARCLFRGVAMKPGGWVSAWLVEEKPLLCLSGNPFAAAATFELFAVPLCRHLAGEADPMPERVGGVLHQPFGKASPGRRFLRAKIKGNEISLPGGKHSSGSLSSFMDCNCLVDIPEGTPALPEGSVVEAVLCYQGGR